MKDDAMPKEAGIEYWSEAPKDEYTRKNMAREHKYFWRNQAGASGERTLWTWLHIKDISPLLRHWNRDGWFYWQHVPPEEFKSFREVLEGAVRSCEHNPTSTQTRPLVCIYCAARALEDQEYELMTLRQQKVEAHAGLDLICPCAPRLDMKENVRTVAGRLEWLREELDRRRKS
jgi:hypothetical protein